MMKRGSNMMKKIEQSGTLSDKVYEAIKQEIVHGNLEDNEALPEERLAKSLGVSRTPLREALRRLADEGLITEKRGSPARVSSFSKEKSLEYMELRVLLEVYNMEKVAPVINDDVLQKLAINVEEQLITLKQKKYHEFMDLDRDFHLLLASLNDNKEIENSIRRLNTVTNRAFLLLSKTLPQSAMDAYEEHVDIIKALKKRDVSLSTKMMSDHLNNIIERFLLYMG